MVSFLPAEYLDPGTPPEVVVTDQLNPPITDSTLGPAGSPRVRPACHACRLSRRFYRELSGATADRL